MLHLSKRPDANKYLDRLFLNFLHGQWPWALAGIIRAITTDPFHVL